MSLHTNVRFDTITSKFNFQGPGLKYKVTVAILRKTVIALVPTFINGFQYNFTEMLVMIVSRARSAFRVLVSRLRSLWLFLEKL